MKLLRASLFLALAAFAPAKALACAACGSGNGNSQIIDSPMVDGMNLGILTLLVVLGTVLATALTLLIYFIRKGEALEIAAQNNPLVAKKV